ncbi:MAG: protein translocase subunit SecD [Actinobacteria bacterium]|nr:protein translocase subunit SecD [Candidatus Planktophila sp.]PHX67006.1 MAG: protein translocase subunit SecD [Actinomycetota bacterium]
MSTPTKPTKKTGRPLRSLSILALLVIALASAAFVQGATAVRLGLDLRGGTSVTLQPRIAPGENGKVTNEAIDQAVSIIRQRVNSLGVAESEVTAQGSGTNRQIVIAVPGNTGRRVVELVGQTAELRFRQVLASGPGAASVGSGASVATGSGASVATGSGAGVATGSTATPVNGMSAAINAKYEALDCTKLENLQGTGTDAPTETIAVCDRNGSTKYILAPAEVLGRQISKASAGLDTQAGSAWYVSLTFNGEGTTAFGALTTRVTSLPEPLNQVAIVLDGLVVSSPRINEPIPSGTAQITGSFTQLEAQDLANVLKYGALPLSFDRGEVAQVSPTLGADQLDAGLLAGIIGLTLVVLYSFLYYRGLGIVVTGSLTAAALVIYLLVLLLGENIGFTLTLAGIAGIIVAVGITADSFVVYFERIRDEIREGRSLRSAVESGWIKARHTILVADAVSIIAAALLYIFAVGGVQGFAFALGLTTLVDLLIVFIFTKPLMTILARMDFFAAGHRFSGLSQKSSGVNRQTSTVEA